MLKIRQFTFNPVQENTYVVFDENGACAIIDPGCYTDTERNELTNFIGSHHLSPKCLLNTHCHLDHVFGNGFITETFNLDLRLHALEKTMLDFAPVSGERWGLPFPPYQGGLVYVDESSELMIGEDALQVLFTPGHSPGSISFYSATGKFVVSGDVLFRGSIGRTDLPGGDYGTLIRSIREKLFVLPEDVMVYSGHGPATTIGEEKRSNPFLV